ncbi:MAG: GNAT family N-acetyltransferase [Acidobacteria bacterium]|nr:MAG: GNAT family N-acetyltransferase [Acidobacteriota bacterium]
MPIEDAAAYPFIDIALSRRLERAEASGNAAAVEARAKISPAVGASWIEVAGAYAMFDGVGSPLTQTFGLGLFKAIGTAEMERLETFFRERGAAVYHEVSPLAHPGLVGLLNERGYQPLEFTSVMFRPLGAAPITTPQAPIRVRAIRDDECDAWTTTAAEGWSELPEVEAFMRDIGRLNTGRADATCFLAEAGGRPIATGVLSMHDGVALLAGASTIPSGRRQGAQLALLDARLRFAAGKGCDLAMMCASPGSASQRNAERHGFRVAYTRLKWQGT